MVNAPFDLSALDDRCTEYVKAYSAYLNAVDVLDAWQTAVLKTDLLDAGFRLRVAIRHIEDLILIDDDPRELVQWIMDNAGLNEARATAWVKAHAFDLDEFSVPCINRHGDLVVVNADNVDLDNEGGVGCVTVAYEGEAIR